MANKPDEGQLPQENVEDTTPEQTEAPQEVSTEQPSEADNLPDKFRGKSPQEIAQAYQELERAFGEKSNRISELENEIAFNKQFNPQGGNPDPYQTPYGNVNQRQEQAQPEPPADNVAGYQDEYGNWTPQGLRKLFRDEMVSMGTEMQKRQQQVAQQVWQARPYMEQAMKESPGAFEGVTLTEVGQTVQNALMNGMPVNLYNPESYKDAAVLMRAKKTQYQFSKPESGAQPEQTPPFTESPSGSHTPEPAKRPIQYQDEAKAQEYMKGFGMTKDQADEIMRKYGDPDAK